MTDDPLVARLLSLDRARHRVGVAARGLDGLARVEVTFPGLDAAPAAIEGPASGLWPPVAWVPLPSGAGPRAPVRLAAWMRDGPARTATVPLGRVPEAVAPTLIVSLAAWDAERGILRVDGWLHEAGLPPGTSRVVLTAGARVLARADLGQPRPDVTATRPLIAARPGWTIRAAVEAPEALAETALEVRLLARDGSVLALCPVAPETPRGEGAGARLRREAAARAALWPRRRLDRLIASDAFRRRWQDGPAACALAREAVADEIARRLGPGDEVLVRLVDGDLVPCQPADDSQLARRYLLFGGDEVGFVRWLGAQVAPGEAAIDAGAAYGVMARAMARAGARVVAVEADDRACGRIRRAGLDFGAGRVELVEAAVAGAEGEVTFAGLGASAVGVGKVLADGAEATVDAFLREVAPLDHVPLSRLRAGVKEARALGRGDVSVRRVPAVTLDGLCVRLGLRDVRILKVDVEGGELEALRGAQGLLDGAFGAPPLVAFEYSDLFPTRGGRREEVLDQFLRRGWALHRFAGGKNEGGDLVPVAGPADAPGHDNLVAIPPGGAARAA